MHSFKPRLKGKQKINCQNKNFKFVSSSNQTKVIYYYCPESDIYIYIYINVKSLIFMHTYIYNVWLTGKQFNVVYLIFKVFTIYTTCCVVYNYLSEHKIRLCIWKLLCYAVVNLFSDFDISSYNLIKVLKSKVKYNIARQLFGSTIQKKKINKISHTKYYATEKIKIKKTFLQKYYYI